MWFHRLLAPALLGIGAFSLSSLLPLPTRSQSAVVSTSTSESRGFQASNSSGFSFNSNGTFAYRGPLNELRPMPMSNEATLEYDSRTITVTPNDALIRSRMPEPAGLANTLSSKLSQGEIPASGALQQIQLGYGLIIPAITRVSGSNSSTRLEQVDSQSLSVFPSFTPTVFR